MLIMILYHVPKRRFYRVEVAENLFGEYSVLREWGAQGGHPTYSCNWFSNLRDAVQAADHWNLGAQRRGYRLELSEAAC